MDKRAVLFGFIALTIVIFLERGRVLDIITKSGGFDLLPGGEVIEELPEIKVPALPGYKPGPDSWTQTTGLMCDCSGTGYNGPVIVNEITVPSPPSPRYIYQTKPVAAQAAQPPMTYRSFGFDSSFAIWGNNPAEDTWIGSDGRVFLQPKGWLKDQPNVSNNPLFIGTNEYRMEGGTIYYGPYVYTSYNGQGFFAR